MTQPLRGRIVVQVVQVVKVVQSCRSCRSCRSCGFNFYLLSFIFCLFFAFAFLLLPFYFCLFTFLPVSCRLLPFVRNYRFIQKILPEPEFEHGIEKQKAFSGIRDNIPVEKDVPVFADIPWCAETIFLHY